MMVLGGERGRAAGSSGRGGDGVGMMGTTDNSLLDVVFLPELSVLLGLVGGRAEVRVQVAVVCWLYAARGSGFPA